MADVSSSATGTHHPTAADDAFDVGFWHNVYTSNSQEEGEVVLEYSSSLDSDWGFVYGESTTRSKQAKKKAKTMDGGSNSSTGMYSSSELSEALSAISAALSLSSTSYSSESTQGKEIEDTEQLVDQIENLQFESNEAAIRAGSTFDMTEAPQEDNFGIPAVGMAFSSEETVYEFYKRYAEKVGFKVRKGKVQRLSDKTIRKKYFNCSREGKKQSNKKTRYKRKETRTGCNARIQCTVENEKWVISQICLEHNHPLKGGRHITEMDPVTAKEVGSSRCMEFCNVDSNSHLCDNKSNNLTSKDVQGLINYFRGLQVVDPSLFYTVQLDDNCRVTNFFWRDGRSKTDYEHFGDVLILDTTFKMSKYDMTCAPFFGLNHHRQYVLFGCAFLLDESKDSLIWLFESFTESMGRRKPRTVFTDEGQPLADAIKLVLPDAQHQIGLWYIYRNALKQLPTCHWQPGFDKLFNDCISGCQTKEEFESRWDSLLQKFNLHANLWFHTLYMLRERWVPAFSGETFCAGIRSNSNINSIFENFMCETVSMSMFAQQYEKAAEQQRNKELYQDSSSAEYVPELILNNNSLEKQAANIYTCTMFKIFQEELLKCFLVAIEETIDDGLIATYMLKEGRKESIVEFSCLDLSVKCSCKKYETAGILCAHALKVLNVRNISDIPEQYILKRWTKSAKNCVMEDDEVHHEGNGAANNQPPNDKQKVFSSEPASTAGLGADTPLDQQADGVTAVSLTKWLDDGKLKRHQLALPPMSTSNACPASPTYSTPTSPSMPQSPERVENITSFRRSCWKKGLLLGTGTFGDVYVVFNCESGEMCAMREVTLFSESKERGLQLEQAIMRLSHLQHPNIVRYYGSEMVDDKLYIYMEYVSGYPINKILQDYGQLGEIAIRSYTQQILYGLSYLHAKQIFHGDIRGANLFIDRSGHIKLADFRIATHNTGWSSPLSFKGCPYWMAPEVINTSNNYDLAVDIWSLGCTVLEMATTKPPWTQYEGVIAMFKIGSSKELPKIPDHLSADGKDFLKKCLQRNPFCRPTAAQLLEHPFVKSVAPPERSMLTVQPLGSTSSAVNLGRSMSTEDPANFSFLVSEGVAAHQTKRLTTGSGSRIRDRYDVWDWNCNRQLNLQAAGIRSPASGDEENQMIRKKLRFSRDQLAILEGIFKEHNYAIMNPQQLMALAKRLKLHPHQVEVWFKMRSKHRGFKLSNRNNEKSTDQMEGTRIVRGTASA